MRKALPVVLILVFVVGCNVLSRRSVTESYKISGDLLESTRVSIHALCDNEILTREKCQELIKSYDIAAKNLYDAGEALKQANRANSITDDILSRIKTEIRRSE